MTQPAKQDGLLVACLCAAWCKTCTEFRGTFDKLAKDNASERIATRLPCRWKSQDYLKL